MAEYTCPACGSSISQTVGKSCGRCGMPYSQQAATPEAFEGELHTVLRPAMEPKTQSRSAESAAAGAPAFLVPPVVSHQAAAGAVEPASSPASARVPPADPVLKNPVTPARLPPKPPVRPGPASRVPASPGGLSSSAPTVLVTILFGVFGAVAASVQTSNARKRGLDTTMYWRAFGITMAVSILAWVLLVIALFAWIASAATV